jgi:cation:H+ antiporter
LVAAARGQGDIAVGNVVGSNLFNILGILGVTALVQPLALGAITWLDLGLMTALAAVLVVRLRVRPILGRGDGTVLLAVFVGYTAWRLVA